MPATFDLILKNGKCFIDGQLKTVDIGISQGIIKKIGKIDQDSNQKILSSAHFNLIVESPQDGFNEQNPEDWVKAINYCFSKILKDKPSAFQSTISIGISGHMHGATLIDKNGKVIYFHDRGFSVNNLQRLLKSLPSEDYGACFKY